MPKVPFVSTFRLAIIIPTLLSTILGCASSSSWTSRVRLSHALVGKIWSESADRFVSQNELINALQEGSVVILGERHDNPDHHRLQAQLIEELSAAKPFTALGMEQLREEDLPILLEHLAAQPKKLSQLGKLLRWEEQGWPSFKTYQGIFEAGREASLSFVALGLKSAVNPKQSHAVPEHKEIEALLLKIQLSKNEETLLKDEILESHCRMVPKEFTARMLDTQRKRDIYMALQASKSDRIILIAGNGHARNDRAIPYYLSKITPERKVISLAFIEVQDGRVVPSEYTKPLFAANLPYDFVWFTPAFDPSDPCEKFSEALKSLHKGVGAK